ncbi:RiPP maturation radical SAM C-methyltransferase [Mesorhizobium sp. STM 4661]|uniref:RiPP maturation radical SAM C-methyltransferase n=1 Tax=Mesorhizobium sp. STM 4661 TaxID=1297570 RepID=UPI0002BDB577|nr:RiPP maturation radical SAM C-methyltransferase [Mesorhizobium sp. STM 4661]CCV14640.1 Radical SAM [Mesorhizobium sp. STM 4661]
MLSALATCYNTKPSVTPTERESRQEWPVALVTTPFVSCYRPSLQLGLLKAIADRHGFPATTLHLNLDFAQAIGVSLYEQLVHHRGRLFGEWLFSLQAFGEDAPDPDGEMLRRFGTEAGLLLTDLGLTADQLVKLRHVEVPKYLSDLESSVDWSQFRVVGFTSTFQQNTAAFALAARIKAMHPSIITLFGGANFEGEMGQELVRSVAAVDYAISGEADESFPRFLEALASGNDPMLVPGVLSKETPTGATGIAQQPFDDLNGLPVPDYDEYFARGIAKGLVSDVSRRLVYLPFESARGCWWGQKHHCTFCGLNGSTMKFRSKSPERVRDELATMSEAYGGFRFEAVDNIVDQQYLNTLFPHLAQVGSDYEFFYEVKSNLTKDKLRVLRDGGLRRIQPGIESLDSRVLKLMRKGVTGIQNVNLLRWSLYYGVDVGWNIIWGFPGEHASFYEDQLVTMRRVRHLQPPTGAGRIWMERFSPIYTDRVSFPSKFVKPEASYAYVYPETFDLAKIAYFFDYELEDSLPDRAYEETRTEVRRWQEAWKAPRRPSLTFWSSPNFIQIEDLRSDGDEGIYKFHDALAQIYVAASDRPATATQIIAKLGLPNSSDEVEAALQEFVRLGLMMSEGSVFLSLALPATRNR